MGHRSRGLRWYDITRLIRAGMPVYPGDPEVVVRPWLSRARGDAVNVSLLGLGSHSGTHVDAPRHLDERGPGVDRLALDALLGPALVVEVGLRPCIEPTDLHQLNLLDLGSQLRLLFKARAAAAAPALSPEAAALLVDAGVRLVGVEAASVDPASATELPAHRLLLSAGVVILENLDLSAVPPGRYELLCLPLNLEAADGAPVRALLRELVEPGSPTAGPPSPGRRGRRTA